jgi:aspartokinase-like uncharacterized kinase
MRRVVKVGGSLLLRPHLTEDLRNWFSAQPPAQTLVIVGGGELIDAVRNLDRLGQSDPATIHWRCVELLQTTFQFLRDWFPDWTSVETETQLRIRLQQGFADVGQPILVAVDAFYSPGVEAKLPMDWRTTTDAIAALLAMQSGSDELVLLKSCPVDRSQSIDELVSAGIIDEAFPLVAGGIRQIRIERLEEASPRRSTN